MVRLDRCAACTALALLLCASPAGSHDFYPPDCCSGKDCTPIAGERVRETLTGFVVDGVVAVPRSIVRPAPDGRYHLCMNFTAAGSNLRCFYAPPRGS